MRSQPNVAGSYESSNAWSSTAVRERWLLTARALSVVDGIWCG
jgi:hypothetical protein